MNWEFTDHKYSLLDIQNILSILLLIWQYNYLAFFLDMCSKQTVLKVVLSHTASYTKWACFCLLSHKREDPLWFCFSYFCFGGLMWGTFHICVSTWCSVEKQPSGIIDKRLLVNLPLRIESGQMFSFIDGLYDFDLSRSHNLHQRGLDLNCVQQPCYLRSFWTLAVLHNKDKMLRKCLDYEERICLNGALMLRVWH